MIDIVTVVFGEELPILSCQAQSLELYCQDLDIGNIFVMVNDDDLAQLIDLSWYGSLGPRVRVIPREQFAVEWYVDGWVNQQLLKMLGATLGPNTWSMILDAKTVLTRPFIKTEWFTQSGQVRLGWMPTIEVFQPAQSIANQLFGSDNHRTLHPGGVPFFFHNDSVKHMIEWVQNKTQQDFKRWFLDQGKLTEFVLYSTWIAIDPDRRDLYAGNDRDSILQICHICHSIADQFDRLLAQHNDSTHTLSIHRRAWSKLSEQQKHAFRLRLIDEGISRAGGLT